MKTKIMMVMALWAMVSALGQNLPIASQDALREYALGHVVRGVRGVTSDSLIPLDGHPTSIEVRGEGAEEVLNSLFNTEIVYALANPDDQITGNVWLYDRDGYLVFWGFAQYKMSEASGKGGGPEYKIYLQHVPLPLDNVQVAEVLVLGEDGTTANRFPLEVFSGHPVLHPMMTGASNGILSVRFRDGSVATYNLASPAPKVPGAIGEIANWKVDGHYVFPPAPLKEVISVKIVETILPTLLVEVKAGQVITLDVVGVVQKDGNTFFERPTSFIHTQVDGSFDGVGPMSEVGPTQVIFPAGGKQRLRFIWRNFGEPNSLYTGPTDGGKG